MKCPYCNQEMIDIKDYCVNCGKKLKKESKNISIMGVTIIFLSLIIVTIIGCYLIGNFNLDKEIEQYIDKDVIKTDK